MTTTPRAALALALVLAFTGCASAKPPPRAATHHGDPAATRRALVLYGSRAGSTAEIADAVGRKLSAAGWFVDVEPVDAGKDLAGYRAVVIGSAIRRGSVLPEIRGFVQTRRAELSRIPVAYFIVCLTMREDTPANREKASGYVDPLRAQVAPVDVGLFAGVMDYAKLDAGARLMAKVAGSPAGDFRDWAAIEAWAGALPDRLGAPR